MAVTLGGSLTGRIEWNQQDVQAGGTITYSSSHHVSTPLANGTGSLQADRVWVGTGTIPGGGGSPVNLDLNALATTILGDAATIDMVKIVGILIENTAVAVNDNALVVGGGTNPFVAMFGGGTHQNTIKARGCLLWTDPMSGGAAANGVSDILRLNSAGANAATYKITIMGRSA